MPKTTLIPHAPYNFPLSAAIFSSGDPQIRLFRNGILRQPLTTSRGPVLVEVESAGTTEKPELSLTISSDRPVTWGQVRETEIRIASLLSIPCSYLLQAAGLYGRGWRQQEVSCKKERDYKCMTAKIRLLAPYVIGNRTIIPIVSNMTASYGWRMMSSVQPVALLIGEDGNWSVALLEGDSVMALPEKRDLPV